MLEFVTRRQEREWLRAQLEHATMALAGAEEQAAHWRTLADTSYATAQQAQQELREARILYAQTLEENREVARALHSAMIQASDNAHIELEQARMLAKTAMDSLVGATAQVVSLSEQMADLQRLGFRPSLPDTPAPDPKAAMAAARMNIEDVDRDLAKQNEDLRAVDDFG